MNTTSIIRRENTSTILQIIQSNVEVSKNTIAGQTDLSQVTVHKIVNELIARGICEECENVVTTGGRNAALFRINGSYGAILGQNMHRERLSTVAYSFALQKLYYHEVECSLSDMTEYVQTMIRELRAAMDAIPGWRVLGVGVSLPGRCNNQGDIINIPGHKTWNHFPLRSTLEAELGVPVCVDNDNNCLAISARYNQWANKYSDYAYLQVCEGVGMGVVIDNRLFRGKYGCSCEIGHTSIMLNGPLCSCGNRGCLDAYLNDYHLLESIRTRCLANDEAAPANLAEAIECARRDPNSVAAATFREFSRYVAIAIEHVYRIFNTEAVFLRCKWLSALPELMTMISDQVFADIAWARRDRFFIILDDNQQILDSSAACLFMDTLFRTDALIEQAD